MNSPRVKICGITTVDDARRAEASGADAIGLVFFKKSPRYVSIAQAAEIAKSVGPFVTVVGLFVDASVEQVNEVLAQVDLHLLQFHGNESEDFCRQFQRPYMKALRMKPELNVGEAIAAYPSAAAILLDAYRKGVPGGTGEVFDWQRVPATAVQPLVLAGGLTPENVIEAIAAVPTIHGVDVSGGVEATPGKKDVEKVSMFVYRAKCGEVE